MSNYVSKINGYKIKDSEAKESITALESQLDETTDISNLTYDIAKFKFNTVSAMKQAYTDEKIGEGAIVETIGYYQVNDGGGATYKVRTKTDSDDIDDGSIIAIGNTLVAELIIDSNVNVKEFGAYGDNIHDDTQAIQKAIDYCSNKKIKLVSDSSIYKITDTLLINTDYLHVEFNGTINNTSSNYAINFKNSNYCHLYFNYIESLNGSGITVQTLLEEDYASCNANIFTFNRIRSNGINLNLYSENSMQYNEYNWRQFESKTKNISLTKLEDGHAWNNESIFNGGKLGGYENQNPSYNIYIHSENSNLLIDGHKFNNVGLEGGNISVYIRNAYAISLNKPRTLENPTTKTLELHDNVDSCKFEFLSTLLSYLDYENATGINYFSGIFLNNSRARLRFDSFMTRNGIMINCNQKDLYFKSAGSSTYGLPTEPAFPNIFYISQSFKLDKKYYNESNINEIYLKIGGIDESTTTQILDEENNLIADLSGIRYKWYKLTLVPSALNITGNSILEELPWTY